MLALLSYTLTTALDKSVRESYYLVRQLYYLVILPHACGRVMRCGGGVTDGHDRRERQSGLDQEGLMVGRAEPPTDRVGRRAGRAGGAGAAAGDRRLGQGGQPSLSAGAGLHWPGRDGLGGGVAATELGDVSGMGAASALAVYDHRAGAGRGQRGGGSGRAVVCRGDRGVRATDGLRNGPRWVRQSRLARDARHRH